jgi:Phytanoyl-CoA dioxygenase (PhyH)
MSAPLVVPLFRDRALAAALDEDGACCVPFLTEGERAEVRALFERLHPEGRLPTVVRGIHMTIHSQDAAFKKAVGEGLRAILAAPCDRLFRDHRLIAPFFIVKPAGEESSVMLHQDTNAVDETRHWAVKLWIPLEACSEEHGTLWYLPRSHRLPGQVRGMAALWPRLEGVAERARPWLRVCEMAPGSAIVFFQRLLHGSPPNRSPALRVAISAVVLPRTVPVRIYVQEGPDSPCEVYETPDDYVYEADTALRDNAAHAPRGGKRVDLLPPHPRPRVRWEDLEPLLGAPPAAPPP